MAEPQEVFDPFLQRVVKVKPGDVIIFKYLGQLSQQKVDEELKPFLESKFGDIPFVIVGKDFDIAVFRPEQSQQFFVA